MRELGIWGLAVSLITTALADNNLSIVSNVTASQRTDRLKQVDIFYDLSDSESDSSIVTVRARNDVELTWNLPMAHVSGVVGLNVTPSSGKQIVWDVVRDLTDAFSGSVENEVAASSVTGRGALQFNTPFADGNVVSVPGEAFDGLADFTMELWLYVTEAGTGAAGNTNTFVSIATSENDNYFALYQTDGGQLRVLFIDATTPLVLGTFNFLQQWVHVAVVRQSSSLTLFVNGEQQNTVSVPSLPMEVPANGVLLGHDQDCVGGCLNEPKQAFTGIMDEVRVWSRALTRNEIQLRMFSLLNGSEPDLVANWRFDEPSGQVIVDSGPFGYDGWLGLTANTDNFDPVRIISQPLGFADQPSAGQPNVTATIDLDGLRVWDPYAPDGGRFVDPNSPIVLDPDFPVYLLTHGWDDTLNGTMASGDCDPGIMKYGMSDIARAIYAHDPNTPNQILGWEWGECTSGSNPNCISDIEQLLASDELPPSLFLLRKTGEVIRSIYDAYVAGQHASNSGNTLATALSKAFDSNIVPLMKHLRFIGHSHGGGLLARAAEQLHDSGITVESLSMLDTPRWGIVDTLDLLDSPEKVGHVVVYYGDAEVVTGAFGAAYDGNAPNVTSIRLNPIDNILLFNKFIPLHLRIRGDDQADPNTTCHPYNSWFAGAIANKITFGSPGTLYNVLDPNSMPSGVFWEGTDHYHVTQMGRCSLGTLCIITSEAICTRILGDFDAGHADCQSHLVSIAADSLSEPEDNSLRLLWFNGFSTAVDWLGSNAVVSSGSDPADPNNVLVRLIDSGDASLFRDIDWPPASHAFSFDYMFDDESVSEDLTVYLDNQVVYYDSADISLARGILRNSGLISLADYAGSTTQLTFLLHNDGQTGGTCLIDNLRVLALPSGDVDFDGDVDTTDALRFIAVLNGVDVNSPPAGSSTDDFDGADFEEDGDVDMADGALMQSAKPTPVVIGEDCNHNAIPDDQDIANGTSTDINENGVPDECELDCNGTGLPDDMDVVLGVSPDCNGNGLPDECDIDSEYSVDVDGNGVPDECE